MTEKSSTPLPEGRRVTTEAHAVDTAGDRSALVASAWVDTVQALADPATAGAVATGTAAVANKIIGEVGETRRHRLTEETKRMEIQARKSDED